MIWKVCTSCLQTVAAGLLLCNTYFHFVSRLIKKRKTAKHLPGMNEETNALTENWKYHTHGASMYVTLCNTLVIIISNQLCTICNAVQWCQSLSLCFHSHTEDSIYCINILLVCTESISYWMLICYLLFFRCIRLLGPVTLQFPHCETFIIWTSDIRLYDFHHTHTHTYTPLSHTQTPISPPHLPDNIRVLEGFKLPQYRHLPDSGERHPLLFRLDTNSFQGYKASSVLQISRLVHFPISAFSNLGHRLILSTCTVFVHFCGFVLFLPPLSLTLYRLLLRILRGIPARVTNHRVPHKGIFTEQSWHMQCLDDRETQMEEDTIFVRSAQTGLQVGNNRTVIMFYSDYQHKSSAASRLPLLLLLLRTATHVLLPLTQMSNNSN